MVCASARGTSWRRLSARRVALHLARGRSPLMVAELEEADLAAVDAILERPGFCRLLAHYRALAELTPEKRREHLACLAWDELLLRLEEGDETALYFVFRMEGKRHRPEEVLADRVIAQEEKALAGLARKGSVQERVRVREPATALPPSVPSSAPLCHALASFELRLAGAEASAREASGTPPAEPAGQNETSEPSARDPCLSEGDKDAAGLPSTSGRQEQDPGLARSAGSSKKQSERTAALHIPPASARRRHGRGRPGSPRIMGKASARHPVADPWKDCFLGLVGYKAQPRDLLANTAIPIGHPIGEKPTIRPQDPLAFLPTFYPRSQSPIRDYKNLLLRGTFIGFDPITAWDCSPDRLFDHPAQPQGP
jgi:hypothetical protein